MNMVSKSEDAVGEKGYLAQRNDMCLGFSCERGRKRTSRDG